MLCLICVKLWLAQGLLPRGEKPNPLREKHGAINKRLSEELDDRAMTTFLKVEDKEFMSVEGVIDRKVCMIIALFKVAYFR